MNRLACIIILLVSVFHAQAQTYTDLADYGYKGPVKSITTSIYFNPVKTNGKWGVTEGARKTTITNRFNADGNFTQKDVYYETGSLLTTYHYKGKTKTGWTKKDEHGIIIETAKIVTDGQRGFTETVLDTSGVKKFESVYTFSKQMRTVMLEDKGYSMSGRIVHHTLTEFEDDNEGHLYKLTSKNRIDNTTSKQQFTILKKDKRNTRCWCCSQKTVWLLNCAQ